jgi:chemotaxis protein methyltransferase CheR
MSQGPDNRRVAAPAAAHPADIEEIELELFVHAMRRRFGYDFSGYATASLRRRVNALCQHAGVDRVVDLLPRLLDESDFLRQALRFLSVPVSELFRDPEVFARLRVDFLPELASYPRINIWQAGCAHGEEVYTMAILLKELGLYDRCRIYATDFNDQALDRAREGIFPAAQVPRYTDNYLQSGGQGSLADYYHARYDFIRMDRALLDNVIFANHNLVTDGVFAETHLVMCRNVLIYFARPLQHQVLALFSDSLVRRGLMVLGTRETIARAPVSELFETLDAGARIFRRTARAEV